MVTIAPTAGPSNASPRVPADRCSGPLIAGIRAAQLADIAALRFDTAVIGCCGLSAAQGLTVYDLDDADIKRAAITSARRVIAVTEAAKLHRVALAFVAPVAALHAVITDVSAPDDEVQAISAAGVTVRKA